MHTGRAMFADKLIFSCLYCHTKSSQLPAVPAAGPVLNSAANPQMAGPPKFTRATVPTAPGGAAGALQLAGMGLGFAGDTGAGDTGAGDTGAGDTGAGDTGAGLGLVGTGVVSGTGDEGPAGPISNTSSAARIAPSV
jgi:hypothetical protein